MNIYKIWQDDNDGWDTYDSAIVIAKNEEAAKYADPGNNSFMEWDQKLDSWVFCYSNGNRVAQDYDAWTHPKNVKVILIGKADINIKEQVICASFNAG